MTKAPPRLASEKWFTRAKKLCEYAAALVLPWLAADLSVRTPLLSHTPLAFSFACIVCMAALADPKASVLSIVSTGLAFNYFVEEPREAWSFRADDMVRTAILLGLGGLIVWMAHRRRLAEKDLRAALAELRVQTDALVQSQQASNSVAWVFDSKTNNMDRHAGGAEIFGYTNEELKKMPSFIPLIHEEDRATVLLAAERTTRTGEPFQTEFRVVWPNGEIHWLESLGAPTKDDPTIWRGVTIDITDRKLAQAALLRSEKLAAAGKLAASFAHEVNNPLASVMNLLYLARETVARPESGVPPDPTSQEVSTYLALAEREIARVAQIASQTLTFHRQLAAPMPVDLAHELRNLLALYDGRWAAEGISVALEIGNTTTVAGQDGELRQVLNTLLRNAIDAMPRGGRLRIRVRATRDWRSNSEAWRSNSEAWRDGHRMNGSHPAALRISIADTGTGIAPEARKRLYEPFFTTKDGIGTGLGLWVAAGIVQNHHGLLKAKSSVRPQNSGTVFSLLLPRGDLEPDNSLRPQNISDTGAAHLSLS